MLAGAPPVMPASLARLAKVGNHLLGYLAPALGVFRPFCPCLGAFRLTSAPLVRPSKTLKKTYTRRYGFGWLIYFKYTLGGLRSHIGYTLVVFRTIKNRGLRFFCFYVIIRVVFVLVIYVRKVDI